jgi:hypothetical protein
VARTYPVACSGVRQRNFDFVFCFFGLARASLGEKQVLDDEYGFSWLITTLFLFLFFASSAWLELRLVKDRF